MKSSLNIMGLATLLVLATGNAGFAQTADNTLVPQNTIEAPVAPVEVAPEHDAGIPAGALGASVKFTNDGANRPVLETLTPDAQGIEIDPSVADYVSQAHTLYEIEDLHEEKGGLPQFNVANYPKQIFWLTLVFAALYFVNARKILPALGATIEGRAARIAGDIETAQTIRLEADALRDSYESAIASAQVQGQQTLADLQAKIKADMEAENAKFKVRMDEQIAALEGRLDAAREHVKDELSEAAAALTVDIAKAVAGISTDDKAAKAAISSLNTLTAKAA